MKRRDFEKHLKKHGCEFAGPGANHDVWINAGKSTKSFVPRHTQIKKRLVLGICKQLGIAKPPKVD